MSRLNEPMPKPVSPNKKSSRGSLDVTGPRPAQNSEALRALAGERLHTMNLMVEEERRNVEQLRQDQAAGATSGGQGSKLQAELDNAVKRLARLEQQLEGMKSGKAPNRPLSTIITSSSVVPPALPPHPSVSSGGSMTMSLSSGGGLGPPPLPARNNRASIA